MHYGEGGSIPLVAAFLEAMPDAEIILWGPEEPQCKIHAPDESVDLGELERCTLAEALFLAGMAEREASGRRWRAAGGTAPTSPPPPPRALTYTVRPLPGPRRAAPRRGVRVGLRSATGNRVGGVTCLEGSNPSLSAITLPRVRRETRGAAGSPADGREAATAERWQSG